MGLFKSIRKARTKAKAEIKAAQAHARKLATEEAKQDFRTAKLLDKAEKRLLKAEKQGLKQKRKHEERLAKAHLQRIEESGITKKKAKQWLGATRLLLPVLLPLFYKGWTSYQQKQVQQRAQSVGLSSQEVSRFSERGGQLKSRVDALECQVKTAELPKGFATDAKVRLAELQTAVENAEHMNPVQQRLAHNSIDEDLQKLSAEVQKKLN